MKLIVGLGNPGKEYEKNRHNVGFMFVDYIRQQLNAPEFQIQSKFQAAISETQVGGEKYIIIEPQTFMNRSGKTVSHIMQFYKIKPTELLVAHDELDVPFGKFKIQLGTGPKLHGGLSSIEELIGTKEFTRIRIGVENRTFEYKIPGETYVLQNFTPDEATQLPTIFGSINTQLRLQKLLYGNR